MDHNTPQSGQPPTQVASGQPQGQPGNQPASKETPDILAGIDLNELPTEVREKLVSAKTTFETTHKEVGTLKQQNEQAQLHARQLQSHRDKAMSVLQRHNIPLDGNPQQPNTPEAALRAQLKEQGIPDDQLDKTVKIFMANNGLQQQQLVQTVGPLAQTVAEMQANLLVQSARTQYKDVFAIPEVAKQIDENVQTLLRQGNSVDQATVDHLVKMAWGGHALSNPQQQQPMNQQQQIPRFGGTLGSGGGVVNQPNQNTQGAPVATQAETVSIMNAIGAEMRRDLPKKGAK